MQWYEQLEVLVRTVAVDASCSIAIPAEDTEGSREPGPGNAVVVCAHIRWVITSLLSAVPIHMINGEKLPSRFSTAGTLVPIVIEYGLLPAIGVTTLSSTHSYAALITTDVVGSSPAAPGAKPEQPTLMALLSSPLYLCAVKSNVHMMIIPRTDHLCQGGTL